MTTSIERHEVCKAVACEAAAHRRGYCHKHYRRRLGRGCYGYRDATEAREHVAKLRDLGWTWKQIGDAAGLSNAVPFHLLQGRRHRRVLAETHYALMSVAAEPTDSHRGVDSTATRRRVQALAWMGWPCAEVARRVGTTRPVLATLILPNRRPSYGLAARVAAVYDELCDVPGPSKIAASKARAFGFAPPAAWDEATIGDADAPPASPDLEHVDEVAVQRVLVGRLEKTQRLNTAERAAAAHGAVRLGWSASQLARALHCSYDRAKQLMAEASTEVAA